MDNINNKCVCGKKRAGLNSTNWSRHVNNCKKKKLTETGSLQISKFFKTETSKVAGK